MKINYCIYSLFLVLCFSSKSEICVNEKTALLDDVLNLCTGNDSNKIDSEIEQSIGLDKDLLSYDLLPNDKNNLDLLNEASNLNNELVGFNLVEEESKIGGVPVVVTENLIDLDQMKFSDGQDNKELFFINNSLSEGLEYNEIKEVADSIVIPNSNFNITNLDYHDVQPFMPIENNDVFKVHQVKSIEQPVVSHISIDEKGSCQKRLLISRVKGVNRTCHRIFRKV